MYWVQLGMHGLERKNSCCW